MTPAGEDPGTADRLARARLGDRAAFADLVRGHQAAVRRQLRRLTHPDAALADDLAQDTFVSAWKALPAYRGDARFATWLHRIALRTWLMHRRAEGADPVDWRLPVDGDAADGDRVAPGPGRAPDDAAGADAPALAIDLARALAALPDAQRLAVLHCCVLELSHDEAARVLGVPLGTVKAHVSRGKSRLRRLLSDWAPAGEAVVRPLPIDEETSP